MNLVNIFLLSLLAENVVLVKFLGICPFVGSSREEKGALYMSASLGIVMVLASIISYLIYYKLLVPYDSEFLRTIIFILVIASLVQMLEIVIKKTSKGLATTLGIYLPLITTNCAVLGVVLLSVNTGYTFLETIMYTLGAAAGFAAVIYVYSTLRERMEHSPIPKSFKGLPIALITAGIMALIFSRYL